MKLFTPKMGSNISALRAATETMEENILRNFYFTLFIKYRI